MISKTIFVALFAGVSFLSFSQNETSDVINSSAFHNLDVSLSTGSMGISAEAATYISDWGRVRGGISYMPTIHTVMHFGVSLEEDDAENTKFNKMAAVLKDMTGFSVDNNVDMDCHASYVNAKVMFDVMPFENKDWHFTVGFFWGTKTIGRAVNTTEDMTTTLAVGMYNSMYDKVYNFEPIFGGISLPLEYEDMILANGRMGMPLGEFKKDGKPYMMEPGEDGTVRAWAKVNAFKPYVGFGWEHQMKNCPEWRYGFDAGVVFWGGVPNVYTHDGTSLTKDVKGLDGKVGDIISFVKCFPVFPLLEFRISRTIF